MEERFIQAVTASQGSLLVFFARPSAAALGIAAIGVWLLPAVTALARPAGNRVLTHG